MFENAQLATLVASKVCHDMVGPMNGMIQGLEMLKGEDGKVDPDALSLLDQGVMTAWAKMEFYRFAIGGALAEGESTLEEARSMADRLFSVSKSDLVWNAPQLTMPRPIVRVVANLMSLANDCLPRGGQVELTGEAGEVRVIATGARASLQEYKSAALRGEIAPDVQPSQIILPYLAGMFARQCGAELSARESEERIELAARSAEIKA